MSCKVCEGKAYIICERNNGLKVIERCDECAANCLSDEQAAVLARYDGIDCAEGYPCYVAKEGV